MVRTRFAPSPTGYMHIGNLRTGLYAYLYAKKQHGKFILRIEDTDRKRNLPQAVRVIYNSLKLARIEYDEGPDKDGGFGPYVQSQRKEIYLRYALELVDRGHAFRCFCSRGDDSNKNVKEIERRDPCRFLSPDQVQEKLDQSIPFVIRQRIPDEGTTTFHDHVFGDITVNNADLDDQVLLKSDGFPTYNFANVVDDHLMEISHVIRGVEYLSSTPKYNLLYQGFGWTIPEYVHLPLIIKENGRKLSKREGDASFEDMVARGYLPEAIINYIALLGWNPGNDREFFTIEDLVQEFDINRINKSRAGFSPAKLDWLNGLHIRALTPEKFFELSKPFYPPQAVEKLDIQKISALIHPRVIRFNEIPAMIDFFLKLPEYDLQLFIHDKSKSSLDSSLLILDKVIPLLTDVQVWSHANLQELLRNFSENLALKVGTVMWPIRIALSGLLSTPGGATEIAEILGREESLRRLKWAQIRIKEFKESSAA